MSDNKLVTLILGGALVFGAALSPGLWISRPRQAAPPAKVVKVQVPDGLVAQPFFTPTDTKYGPPFNVRVHCEFRGGPGVLDPMVGAKPGETVVQTCKSYAWKAPSAVLVG